MEMVKIIGNNVFTFHSLAFKTETGYINTLRIQHLEFVFLELLVCSLMRPIFAVTREETPAQAEARVNASKKIKVERFSRLWNWAKEAFTHGY